MCWKIVTLPGRGALKLDGVPVSAGDSIPQALVRLSAGDLTYTPPRGQVGEDMSSFTFKVNDGVLDSVTYTMTINVDNRLVGNLGAPAAALSLPDGSYNAYAQLFETGSSAQELDEVKLAITVPSGTTPKVSIWDGDGDTEPEWELTGLALSNPSNIHTADDAVKTFKAEKRYSLATNRILLDRGRAGLGLGDHQPEADDGLLKRPLECKWLELPYGPFEEGRERLLVV